MSTDLVGGAGVVQFDLDAAWRLNPQVSVRRERFGALLYDFGSRRLSFLKNPTLVTVVNSLNDSADARSACISAGVSEADLPAFTRALATLAASNTICERPSDVVA